MARPAPIRLAGTIAATALCAALAVDANAQDAAGVLNEQLQLGDVFSHQQLNVVDAAQQVTSSNTALANHLTGGSDGQALFVTNRQTGFAAAVAQTRLNMQGQNNGRVAAVAQARINDTSIGANNARLTLDSQQAAYGSAKASVALDDPQVHLVEGASLASAAYGNALHVGGANVAIDGTVSQLMTADTTAETYAPARFVRGPTHVSADATANNAQIIGTGSSGQNLSITQDSRGWVGADSNASAGNAWNSVTTASAAANRIALYNNGGAQVATIDQSSISEVSSRATTFAYDYGDLRALAEGVGNHAVVGNADIWVEIDSRQINSGGVSVEAELSGHNGYDAYVGATATGNSITGYACSECGGSVRATNSQTNSANISASATTNLTGASRAVITGTNATGNSASFYVTRPGG